MDEEDTPPVEGRLLNQISRRSTKETEMIHMSRKTAVTSFLMICAVAIAATPAIAQGVAFQASSLPLQARGEGLTETIGAVVLQATATGTVPAGSSITIVYSGTIANASSFTGTAGLSCSIAPQGSITALVPCGAGVFTTSATGSQLTVQFNSAVTFTAGNYIEVSQVRMNVNGLGSGTTTVTATLSGTSSLPASNPITFTQSTVGVSSIVNPSVKGSVASSGVAAAVQTCAVPVGQALVGTGGNAFVVTVGENYPAAITSTADETAFSALGTIANGSLINIVLSNVPSGLAVQANGYSVAGIVTASGGSTAALEVFGTPIGTTPAVNTAGPPATAPFQGAVALVPGAGPGAYTVNLLAATPAYQASTGSTMTWTFSVVGDSTSALETFSVYFGIGLPNSKNTGVSGSIAALPSIGTIVTATAAVSLAPSSGIVSFATNNEGGGTIATISDCVTNMMFPYVTNQAGYDTSFSIANTTSDDLAFGAGQGATAQSGSCTMSLWPTADTTLASSSPLGTASQYTTPTIPSGTLYAFSQSGTSFSGQTGYVIAVCRFLNAHGFAFLTNGFAQSAGPQLSHGYLGLVLPNPITGRTSSNGETAVN